ncbi:MAG: hypothetical protein ACM3UZ_02640 [Acidobacteriota bacterium]
MRKRSTIIMIILAFLVGALLVAQSAQADPYGIYTEAMKKTAQLPDQRVQATFEYHMNFAGKPLSPEAVKKVDVFRNIKGTINLTTNHNHDQAYADGRINLAGTDLQFKAWFKQDQTLMLLPMFTKYMVITEETKNNKADNFRSLGEKFQSIWEAELGPTRVTRAQEKLISTPDGDMRVTEYHITQKDVEVRKCIQETLRIIFSDPQIRQKIVAIWLQKADQPGMTPKEAEAQIDVILDKAIGHIDSTQINHFTRNVAIDKDLYILQADADYSGTAKDSQGVIVNTDFSIKLQRYGIGKPVTIEWPETNSENSFPPEQMDQNLPQLLGDFLK